MDSVYLGRSGMKVSRLCLGTMNFGVLTDEQDAFRIMDEAHEAGIVFFDTADVYGWGVNAGRTEEILGRWFAQGGGRRERTILATKVYGDMHADVDGPNREAGLSAYKVRRHLEGSLRRLRTDHVELYQMHHVDRSVSWDELWGVFETLVAQGMAYYIGSSNFAGWDLAVAQGEAKARHFLGLVSEQHKYNLNCRLPELEVLPAAAALGIGVIAWSPLDGGLLGRSALHPADASRTEKSRSRIEAQRDRIEAFARFCDAFGAPQDVVALAWLLAQPGVTAPVVGPRTPVQLEECLRALECRLGDSELAALDAIFPGPGGSAPAAYAW